MKKTTRKLTEEKAKKLLEGYFCSRKVVKRDSEGNPVVAKTGEVLFDERPCTVTGIAVALGMSRREELFSVKDKKVKALVDRALLRVEESAEEKLFFKDTVGGAKLFLSTNFKRWAQESTEEEEGVPNLGVCSLWAE